MLQLGRADFTCGRTSYLDAVRGYQESTAKIFVKAFIEGRIDYSFYAQLDTGAAWSILDPALAQTLGLFDRGGRRTHLHTRFGRLDGLLVRSTVTFLADVGDPLDTDATFFISPNWPEGLNFLGYSGLLESIRFALDPQVNHFYFGPGA
ncbi:MAG: hypothetical protein ACJ75H_00305 [Thermoanaerobaculia bacterium]